MLERVQIFLLVDLSGVLLGGYGLWVGEDSTSYTNTWNMRSYFELSLISMPTALNTLSSVRFFSWCGPLSTVEVINTAGTGLKAEGRFFTYFGPAYHHAASTRSKLYDGLVGI